MEGDASDTVLFETLERVKPIHVLAMLEKDETFYAVAFLVAALLGLWIIKRLCIDEYVENFHQKYVLVTGCDSGFGRETVLRLDSLGFNVFATCLTSEGEAHLSASCSKRLITLHMDVTSSQEIKQAFDFVAQHLPENTGLWAVINNAGIAKVGPVEWLTINEFKQVADVNLWGLIDVTKVFLPLVKKQRGRIINIASIAGRACLPHAAAYCISKFGVEAFSDALRRELSPKGVKVSVIEPGFFLTNITNKDNLKGQWLGLWTNMNQRLREEYGESFYQTSVQNMLTGMVDTCASPHLYKVVDSIVHSLTSRYPKTRYVIGWDAHLLWIWISRLPAAVGDALLNMLGEKAEPSACAGASMKRREVSKEINGNNNAMNGFIVENDHKK